MSCPDPKTPSPVEVLAVTVHPEGHAETLGDRLDLEQQDHLRTRELLTKATQELEQLRPVAAAAHAVVHLMTLCTRSLEQESALFAELTARLLDLGLVLAPPLAQVSEHEAALREEEWRSLQPLMRMAWDVWAGREAQVPGREVCVRLLRAWQARALEEFRTAARQGVRHG